MQTMFRLITILQFVLLWSAFTGSLAFSQEVNPSEGDVDGDSELVHQVLDERIAMDEEVDTDATDDYAAEPVIPIVPKREIYVSIAAVCLLALVTFVFTGWLMRGPSHASSDLIAAVALPSIIYATLLLVLVANTNEQLSGATTIIGAVAGYVFGSMKK